MRLVLPEFVEADTQLQNLPATLPLDVGKNWRQSVVISEDASAEADTQKQAAPDARRVNGLLHCYPARLFSMNSKKINRKLIADMVPGEYSVTFVIVLSNPATML